MNDIWYSNTLDELNSPHAISQENLYCILSDAIIAFLDKRLPVTQLLDVLHGMQKLELMQKQSEFSSILADFIVLSEEHDAATAKRNEIIGLLERAINLITLPHGK